MEQTKPQHIDRVANTESSEHFSAEKIAAAVGVTSRNVRKRLRAVPGIQIVQKGKSVTVWTDSALPPEWREKLKRLAARDGCRNVAHFIATPAPLWAPKTAEHLISAEHRTKAEAWRDILCPVLKNFPDAGTAEVARKARARAAAQRISLAASDSTLERIIKRARERIGNRDEFERWVVYLDEAADKPHVESSAEKTTDKLPGSNFESAVIALRAEPKKHKNLLWLAAFEEFTLSLANGNCERTAKRETIALLIETGLLGDQSNESLRKTFERNLEKWRAGDEPNLEDGRRNNKGRAPLVAADAVTDYERDTIKRLHRQTGSAVMALTMFADDPKCSDELRDAILKARSSRHNLPLSLRRLANVTPESELYERGAREFNLGAYTVFRDDTILHADGSRTKIAPNTIWEADDMSLNQPYWFEAPNGADDALAKKHDAAIGRQGLYLMDVKSGKWLSVLLVGRARDAYRAADIMTFFRHAFETFGMPEVLRLERGTWMSKTIIGTTSPWLKAEADRVIGGLRGLGVRIEYTHNAKGKGCIETGFGYLQKALTVSKAPNIGRFRGERSRDGRLVQRAKSGSVHPKDIGIPTLTRCVRLSSTQ